MRILFDNSTPRGLARALEGHLISEARDYGWDRLSNGQLLDAAEKASFDILVTPDQNMTCQQNLTDRKIAIVVLGKGCWTLVKPHVLRIAAVVASKALAPGAAEAADPPG